MYVYKTLHFKHYSGDDGSPVALTPEKDNLYQTIRTNMRTEVQMETDGSFQNTTVIVRTHQCDGILIGTYNQNIILDTRVYTVQLPDVNESEYTTKIIATNIITK